MNDSEYVYLPDYDGEWSFMLRSEYNNTGGEDKYGLAQPAEFVFNLDVMNWSWSGAPMLSVRRRAPKS